MESQLWEATAGGGKRRKLRQGRRRNQVGTRGPKRRHKVAVRLQFPIWQSHLE